MVPRLTAFTPGQLGQCTAMFRLAPYGSNHRPGPVAAVRSNHRPAPVAANAAAVCIHSYFPVPNIELTWLSKTERNRGHSMLPELLHSCPYLGGKLARVLSIFNGLCGLGRAFWLIG